MPLVEAYDNPDPLEPLFIAEFDFLPRVGELIARDTPPGYFVHHKVVEVWHRQDTPGGAFRACIQIELDD